MPSHLETLAAYFERDVCQRATKPLRVGVTIALYVGEEGPFSLERFKDGTRVTAQKPENPDMTFRVPPKGLERLAEYSSDDIGEIGVHILKLMADPDPNVRIQPKVHIGLFEFLRNGYLGILPLGGTAVMKFLATKGLTSLGKIKDAIARLRETR